MTAVMRAVSQETGPKILRIGVVQSGKVIDERLIKQRENVTIGPSEKAMFVVPSRKIPPNFPVFQLVNNQYHLNYLEGMTGRVALKTGVADLKQLKAQAKQDSIAGATAYKVQLGEDARGKIVVGETTFLFQFVVKPPEPPRAQLPVAVKKGFAGDIDWFTTIVASFSFLLHFMLVLMAYAYDPPVDDEYTINRLVEMGKSVPPPPPLEKPKAEAEETEDDSKEKKEEAPKTAKAAPKSKAAPGPKTAANGEAGAKAEADAKAADIASQLAALDVQTVGALNSSGPAVAGVLGEGEVPVGLLDDAGAQNSAAGTGEPGGLKGLGGKGSGSVTPGSGGKGNLSDIGNTGSGTSGSATDAGEAKKVEGPKGNAVVGGAGVAGGAVSNASSVVARMRGRFRACYQQGLNSNPNLEGQVVLTAKIGPSGQVTGVGGGGGGLGSIVGCLKAVVSSGAFSPPEGGSAVVSIPITFVKQ